MSGLTDHDLATLSEGMSHPGIDPRTWFSHGIVDQDTSDSHSVRFNDEQGSPLPHGVLVDVKLYPLGVRLPCRVSMQSAGAGEGEYNPYGPGDEVFVAIPDGDMRHGGVIMGRGSNALDVFPTTVAGVDVTQNNIAFKRIKLPYVLETGASYLIRSALTNASFSMDPTGNIMLTDGNGDGLFISNTAIQLGESTASALLQIDPSKLQVAISANGTSFLFDKDASSFLTSGTLQICTSGSPTTGHAVTLEQVIVLMASALALVNTAYALTATPATALLLMQAAIPAALLLPATPYIPLITTALQTPIDPTGTLPGLGKPGLLF